MPEYVRRCAVCCEEYDTTEPMHAPEVTECPYCGGKARRKPGLVAVNWGGLPPSRGHMHPDIKHLIEDAPRRRDQEMLDGV